MAAAVAAVLEQVALQVRQVLVAADKVEQQAQAIQVETLDQLTQVVVVVVQETLQ
jgi:hypothetical protein